MTYKVAFIGAQTGDEGKGVRVDHYVKKAVELSGREDKAVWTMRWQGGANAGHTVESDGQKYALHQIPSGILIPGTYNLMGAGVFLNPRACLKEIGRLRERGVCLDGSNFGIASNAHVTLDYHIEADTQDSRLQVGHTSTGKGIRPTSEDKYGRRGIRFQEFINPESFKEALRKRFPDGQNIRTLDDAGNVLLKTIDQLVDSYATEIQGLREYSVLEEGVLSNPKFDFGFGEGAQGFLLDVDRGLYPGVTSSNPSVPPFRANKIVGVVKSYASSIGGDRPFIGEMDEELQKILRPLWKEHGTTTGKPRSLGCMDIVALRHAIRSADIDCLISTCGDRLEDLAKVGAAPRLVVAYRINGRKYTDWDPSFHDRKKLYEATPEFEEFEAWDVFFDKKRSKLTDKAQRFMDRVEKLTGTEIIAHGHGPGINDVLEIKDVLRVA